MSAADDCWEILMSPKDRGWDLEDGTWRSGADAKQLELSPAHPVRSPMNTALCSSA